MCFFELISHSYCVELHLHFTTSSHSYCVAPVVSEDPALVPLTYWAVGKNCCHEGAAKFECGNGYQTLSQAEVDGSKTATLALFDGPGAGVLSTGAPVPPGGGQEEEDDTVLENVMVGEAIAPAVFSATDDRSLFYRAVKQATARFSLPDVGVVEKNVMLVHWSRDPVQDVGDYHFAALLVFWLVVAAGTVFYGGMVVVAKPGRLSAAWPGGAAAPGGGAGGSPGVRGGGRGGAWEGAYGTLA